MPTPEPAGPPSDPWGETLSRRLGLASAIAVLVGSTIGSGIFRTPAGVAAKIGDERAILLAWVLGGVLALCGAATYAELSAMFPRSGGLYVFLREAFGRPVAFLFGWAELLVIRPGAYGAIAITAAAYGLRSLGIDPAVALGAVSREQALGAVLIAVVAGVNALGIERGAVLQNASTALKVLALAGIVALGLTVFPGSDAAAPAPPPEGSGTVSLFLLAMVSILWAYDGWADLSFVGGEIRNPQRTLPIAVTLGTGIVVLLYIGANLAYLALVPLDRMIHSDLVAADAAAVVLGGWGTTAVCAAVAVSTFGTLNGSMMTSPRIFFAMAEDGLMPGAIAGVDRRSGAPTGAIALCAILGIVFVSVRTFTALADQFVIGIWPFYALGVIAVVVLRRTRPEVPRPYRTVGYPWVPAAFLVASLFLLGNYVVTEPVSVAVDVGVVLLGLPVYLLATRRR